MDDAWSCCLVESRRQFRDAVHEPLHEGPRVVPLCGMNHHSYGLVHNDYAIVLVQDTEVYRFGLDARGLRLVVMDVQPIAGAEPVRELDGTIINDRGKVSDLGLTPAEQAENIAYIPVYPHAAMGRILYRDASRRHFFTSRRPP